jgi:hypothetical protein
LPGEEAVFRWSGRDIRSWRFVSFDGDFHGAFGALQKGFGFAAGGMGIFDMSANFILHFGRGIPNLVIGNRIGA